MKFKTTGTYLLILLLAVGALLLVSLRSVSSEAVYPVERATELTKSTLGSRIAGAWNGARAAAENRQLRRDLKSLEVLRSELERLQAENARLRTALGYVTNNFPRFVAASVLSHGGAAGVRKLLRVNKGSKDGIHPRAVVTVPEGLVGLVTEVSPHTALVQLITDPTLKVSAQVELAKGPMLLGVLSGGSDEALHLKYLSGAESLPPHSRVLTSGRGGVFPPGLVIGTLLEIRHDDTSRLQAGEVQPSVDYSTLEDVFIRCEN